MKGWGKVVILLLLPLRLELRLALRRAHAAVRLAARTEVVVHVDVAQPWLRAIAAARLPRRPRVRLAGHARV